MSEKQARRQRQRTDRMAYQVVLISAVEWNKLDPGHCSMCHAATPHPRARFTGYDSGSRSELVARPGEPDSAHADRMYRVMNAHQREGDFTPMAPPRASGHSGPSPN